MLPVLLDSCRSETFRVLLLFLALFLQELGLLHGWIEHALLPPDYMDLWGIFINSSAAARVCTILQTQQPENYRFVKTEEGEEEGEREMGHNRRRERRERGLFTCYWQFDRHQTYQYGRVPPHQLHMMTFARCKSCMLWHTYKFNHNK